MSIYFKSRNKPVNKYVISPSKLLIYWPFYYFAFLLYFRHFLNIGLFLLMDRFDLFVFFIFIPINIFLVNRLKKIYFWDLNRYVLKSCISSNLSVPFGLFWCLMCFFIVKILSLLFTKSHKYLPINNTFYNSTATKF